MSSTPVAVYPVSENRILHAFGDEVELYFTGEETGGQFVQARLIVPPGGGPPPHFHTQEDEWFYVLEGTVSFFSDGVWHAEMGAGGRIWCPRNSVHTFKNTGAAPLQMLVTSAPAGFEIFFGKCAVEFARAGGPDMARLVEIAAEHGIHFVVP